MKRKGELKMEVTVLYNGISKATHKSLLSHFTACKVAPIQDCVAVAVVLLFVTLTHRSSSCPLYIGSVNIFPMFELLFYFFNEQNDSL